jgi:hypothetical protein
VQRPENAPFLTDEDEAGLARYVTDPTARLLIWGERRGFALFCGVGMAGGVVELRRLCLDHPGQGEGAVFIKALIDLAFGDYAAERLWLDASGENLRAQRVYAREGFTLEGRLRAHNHVAVIGRSVDTLFYGMMRAEWRALRGR